MLSNLTLSRPLVFLDLETTGLDVATPRIVEIAMVKIYPAQAGANGFVGRTYRVNPCVPIPAGASAVHGIDDAAVSGCPTFAAIAPAVASFLEGCDLGGFNAERYDVPLLHAELHRWFCPHSPGPVVVAVVDPMRIFHANVRSVPGFARRSLAAAVSHYLGRNHRRAHSAEADVLATIEILDAQCALHGFRTVEDVVAYQRGAGA